MQNAFAGGGQRCRQCRTLTVANHTDRRSRAWEIPGPSWRTGSPETLPSSETGLLTPEELARRLKVTRRCLSNWSRDRIIPMVKIGRICRFDYPKVRAALERYEQAAATR